MPTDPSEVDADEREAYRETMIAEWERQEAEEAASRAAAVAPLLEELGLSQQDTRCDRSLVIAVSDGLLRRHAPTTHGTKDKDGLYEFPADFKKMMYSGYFRAPDDERLVLIPAVAFRRGFGERGTYNEKFFGALVKAAVTHGVSPRLRFTEGELGIASSFQMYMESDYWRGVETLYDLRELEEGHLKRHTYYDDTTAYLHGFVSAEIHAQGADDRGVRGLRLEEVHYDPHSAVFADGQVRIAERFVHAELHPDGTVGHLDGALRGYTEEEWRNRRELYATDLRDFGRVGTYEKQFLINAPLTQKEFADISANYFRGNHLMLEVLEGLREDQSAQGGQGVTQQGF